MQTPGQIRGLSGSERSSTAITKVIVLFGIFFCTSHTIQTAVIDEKQQDKTEEAIDPSIQALAKQRRLCLQD